MRWMIIIVFALSLQGCRKEEKGFLFEMEYPVDFTINAGIGPFVTHYFEVQGIPTFADSLFAFHNVQQSVVTDILPRNGQMIPIFTNIDYAFIRSIDIQLYDEVSGTVKSIPAFYRDPVPENTGEIVDLVAEELDLKEFLLKDKVNIRIKLQLFEPAPKTVESRLILKFAVR